MSYDTQLLISIQEMLASFGDKYLFEGEPKIETIQRALNEYDDALVTAIYENELLCKTFMAGTGPASVLKVNMFLDSLRPNDTDYWQNSYTRYRNKIGLTANSKFIDENPDVVLAFPYKDSLLEGGMTREDQENSHEIFYNQTIARAEIDQLLDSKAFMNVEKVVSDQTDVTLPSSYDNENLVIKGNNLLVNSSLLQKFKGKFKMIYLDPPYNTENDDFPYNDKFSHSTWLTFMNSRLRTAKELLRPDGAIYVSIDDKEAAYLKVLMDNVFGRDNFLTQFNVQVRYAEKTLTEARAFNKVVEYTLMYAKDASNFVPNQPVVDYTDEKFVYDIEELTEGETIDVNGQKVTIFKKGEWQLTKKDPSRDLLKETWISGSIYAKMSYGQVYKKYVEPRVGEDGNGALYKIHGRGDDGRGYRYYTNPQKKSATRGKMFSGMPLDRQAEIDAGLSVKKLPISNSLDYAAEFGNIRHEGGVQLNSGKKPENLIKGFIDIATQEGDWVLDFFGGSGTTAATAMKSGRKFVTVEQITTQMQLIRTRLSNVLNGDETGISNDVGWQGGGEYIYMELASQNSVYYERILNADDERTLWAVFKDMENEATLNFKLELDKIDLKSAAIQEMGLAAQKELLINMLDLNQMYLNYSDVDNHDVNKVLSENDKLFNKNFYGKEV